MAINWNIKMQDVPPSLPELLHRPNLNDLKTLTHLNLGGKNFTGDIPAAKNMIPTQNPVSDSHHLHISTFVILIFFFPSP
ncbi:hypothetical protein MTR_7g076645 [Medicago truncatula]|uniref:Uncharacterized protein n=1 Tax=Medicago truncatula TaxID=3880 RepID=A0A072U1P2_MEDTR|nr:hypothetical protein MTR_7g076645 [Medicago truncatula]